MAAKYSVIIKYSRRLRKPHGKREFLRFHYNAVAPQYQINYIARSLYRDSSAIQYPQFAKAAPAARFLPKHNSSFPAFPIRRYGIACVIAISKWAYYRQRRGFRLCCIHTVKQARCCHLSTEQFPLRCSESLGEAHPARYKPLHRRALRVPAHRSEADPQKSICKIVQQLLKNAATPCRCLTHAALFHEANLCIRLLCRSCILRSSIRRAVALHFSQRRIKPLVQITILRQLEVLYAKSTCF